MDIAQLHNRDRVEVRDVLYWSMEETITNTKKILPIWVKQGIAHQRHLKAWTDIGNAQRFPEGLRERESKSLKEHYGFGLAVTESIESIRSNEEQTGHIEKIVDTCKEFGMTEFRGATMLEEQERELAHEVECERENQPPPAVRPVQPRLAGEVRQFITTGTLNWTARACCAGFVPAFDVLKKTSAKVHWQQDTFSSKLLTTPDFCNVIETGRQEDTRTDDFLRPVNWIVSSTSDPSILVILSSYEVNLLLPQIRQSQHVRLHMYTPRVTLSMPSHETLDYHPIPPLQSSWRPDINLVDQLNIFAGQLYFRDYDAYKRVCAFLGLCLDEPLAAMGPVRIHSDGFVDEPYRGSLGMEQDSPFHKSPVPLLRALVAFRRKGQDSMATDMGRVLHGRLVRDHEMKTRVRRRYDLIWKRNGFVWSS